MALTFVTLLPLRGEAVDRGKQVVVSSSAPAAQLLDTVENAIWAADGQAADKPVYVLYSTDCAWSKRLYDDTRSLAGKVQLRWIPVAGGTATGVVAARDGASIAGAFNGRSARLPDTAAAQRGLAYNQGVMDSVNYQMRPYDRSSTFAFPTLVYRTRNGVKLVAGNPRNLAALPADVLATSGATSMPAGIAISAQPISLVRSRNLPKWSHRQATPVVFHAAPSPQAPPIDDLGKDLLIPVSGIVGTTGWIEVAPWGADKRKAYVHDPVMARMATLEFRVKPQGGQWQARDTVQVREFPDAEAPVLETLNPGERYQRRGMVDRNGEAWEQIVLYADGTTGYVKR
ncbi:hypothetical protein [uncultured Pseudoxanthomonas sp.]|uniref:hypothetical protein n=1 Tax=uncultured Pseudoxanthomonas sp. TaxID=281701 RepID=UPI002621E947|nr:hypothetical protein [uncultured Pseudoxanthomonas sp.]